MRKPPPNQRDADRARDSKQLLTSGEAWHQWCDRLKAAGDTILQPGFPESPSDRAEGFRWLTRLMVHATQIEIEAGDPLHPHFVRYETPTNQWGGPNPDNIYLRANVDPQASYRIWADVTGMRQAIFSLNQGEMHLGEYAVFGEVSLDQLQVEDSGRLQIVLSPERHDGNWIAMHPQGRLLTIRIYQSDWEHDAAPVFHIERIGHEGEPKPALTAADLTRALDRSATWVEKSAGYWNAYTQAGWKHSTPNQINAASSPKGGADNILYGSCFFELGEDEALVITTDAPDAAYWGFCLHTLGWLESGDFADRQTSLNDHQLTFDNDGRVRVVLAHQDPGCPNWLDTEQRPRGLLVFRWVWSKSNPLPCAQKVRLCEVGDALPANHPRVSAEQRRQQLARRREAAWNRFQ